MTGQDKQKKNTLSICLNESAVFLRTAGPNIRRHQNATQPGLLRGLLVLDLVKPTKITSIEVELVGKTSTSWPEGIGTRRVEIAEEHELFHESAIYFQAGETKARRTASLGPGVAFPDEEHAIEEGDDDHEDGIAANNHGTAEGQHWPVLEERGRRGARRLSADSSVFQRAPPLLRQGSVLTATPPLSPVRSQTPQTSDDPPSFLSVHSADTEGVLSPVESTPSFQSSFAPPTASPPYEPPSTSSPSHFPSPDRSHENEVRPSTPHSQNGSSPDFHPTHRKRFSLAMVSNALLEVVRPHSPRSRGSPERSERSSESAARGRMLERNVHNRLSDMLKTESKDHGASWKEFKKGTYTYPISFAIPGSSPPSMTCPYGTVTWRLNAVVHRPGAFKAKMATSHRVIVVTYPAEEETEIENLVVERDWDSQLEYLISVPGRNFYIGGSIPLALTILPLTKLKIYRIAVYLEERVDYYTRMKRIIRTDPIVRLELVSAKADSGSSEKHLLPLESDGPNALANSPLSKLMTPNDDISEAVSSYMGPGPWTFHLDLKLPASCRLLRFTNKNRRSNITVTHLMKVVIRSTRGDDLHVDAKSGRRRLFDIVVSIPIQILSCRCNPEWTALPRYSATLEGATPHSMHCPCEIRRITQKNATPSSWPLVQGQEPTSDSESDADTVQVDSEPRLIDTMLQRNTLFERLVAGRESEMGEAPPAYDGVVQEGGS